MIKSIRTTDLRLGMFVILPVSWINHPFSRSKFLLKSASQIQTIKECGFEHLDVDFGKSSVEPPQEKQASEKEEQDTLVPEAPEAWEPETLVPSELQEAIADQDMDPESKAEVVYNNSLELMARLLESPTAENIHTCKDSIKSVTNLILSDDATARNLLLITSHDFYTYTHSVNVGITAVMLAKELFRNSDAHDLEELGAGFFLHDLGKVNVDPRIINKPARLNEEEMNQIRTHPFQGYKILKDANALTEECKYIVLQHHEQFDGSGYPKHLAKDEIHLYSRICCLADVFEALTAERSYKKGMSRYKALKVMRDEMPNHFGRDLLNPFIMLFQ